MIPYSQIRRECDLLDFVAKGIFLEEIYVHKTKPIVFTCAFSEHREYNLPITISYKYINE